MFPPAATRLPALLVLALLAACPEPEAPIERVGLEATGDTLLVPYGDIARAAWLGGARWVVVAPQDRAVTVADFGAGKVAPFAGPRSRELDQPFELFRAVDSIFVADWMRRRLTGWSLDGRLGSVLPAADRLRGALPRARDAAGRWYFELHSPPGPDGSGNRDSASVVRTPPDVSRVDTVARLAPFDLVEIVTEGRRRLERRLLSGQDRWGVLPDGSIWIARVSQSRVDWRDTTGALHEGRGLPDRVLPVTQVDRDLFLARFEVGLRSTVAQTPFAAVKPPFDDAVADPAGLIWVVKNRAVGDTIRDYQLVDRRGHQVGAASHPGLGRILAIGDSLAMVGEPYADGMRLLLFRRRAGMPGGVPSSGR